MTEEEWITTTDPSLLVRHFHGKASRRKLRLLVCSCCRAVWDDEWPRRCRQVVETAERFADGLASPQDLNRARSLASGSAQSAMTRVARSRRPVKVIEHVRVARLSFAADAALPDHHIDYSMTVSEPRRVFSQDPDVRAIGPSLIRCVFGNPFRPVTFDPRWRTADAVGLAEGIYHDRAFSRLPLLADALMDAGCDDEQVIGHCRSDGPHVRGCWVVDLVLGKE
jgi:hypothetical protein